MASTTQTKTEELRVPEVGESISEVVIGQWHKQVGDLVKRDEELVELESEKATFEAPSPVTGVLTEILKKTGDIAAVGEVIALLEAGATSSPLTDASPSSSPPAKSAVIDPADQAVERGTSRPAQAGLASPRVMPAAARAMADQGLRPSDIQATGPGGRLLKEDVLRQPGGSPTLPPEIVVPASSPSQAGLPSQAGASQAGERIDERVRMSPLRKTIATRLVEAQKNAALLTTFNEADLSAVKELRKEHGAAFEKKHGVKLGFMAFFVKAAVEALKNCPGLNARIDGDEIVYQRYFDIGIAIGVKKGLVVPILRNADQLGFADIEHAITDFAVRAKAGKLTMKEMLGGTFTISNGGVYGSLLSTPIVNPPQSGVLGMHTIQERPIAIDGNVVIRPMMYLALTYDHRIVDGREAVTFLREIKEAIEEPARILIEI